MRLLLLKAARRIVGAGQMSLFDELDHPRDMKGSPQGGEFVNKIGQGEKIPGGKLDLPTEPHRMSRDSYESDRWDRVKHTGVDRLENNRQARDEHKQAIMSALERGDAVSPRGLRDHMGLDSHASRNGYDLRTGKRVFDSAKPDTQSSTPDIQVGVVSDWNGVRGAMSNLSARHADGIPLDGIVDESRLSPSVVSYTLTLMELAGEVKRLPGNHFVASGAVGLSGETSASRGSISILGDKQDAPIPQGPHRFLWDGSDVWRVEPKPGGNGFILRSSGDPRWPADVPTIPKRFRDAVPHDWATLHEKKLSLERRTMIGTFEDQWKQHSSPEPDPEGAVRHMHGVPLDHQHRMLITRSNAPAARKLLAMLEAEEKKGLKGLTAEEAETARGLTQHAREQLARLDAPEVTSETKGKPKPSLGDRVVANMNRLNRSTDEAKRKVAEYQSGGIAGQLKSKEDEPVEELAEEQNSHRYHPNVWRQFYWERSSAKGNRERSDEIADAIQSKWAVRNLRLGNPVDPAVVKHHGLEYMAGGAGDSEPQKPKVAFFRGDTSAAEKSAEPERKAAIEDAAEQFRDQHSIDTSQIDLRQASFLNPPKPKAQAKGLVGSQARSAILTGLRQGGHPIANETYLYEHHEPKAGSWSVVAATGIGGGGRFRLKYGPADGKEITDEEHVKVKDALKHLSDLGFRRDAYSKRFNRGGIDVVIRHFPKHEAAKPEPKPASPTPDATPPRQANTTEDPSEQPWHSPSGIYRVHHRGEGIHELQTQQWDPETKSKSWKPNKKRPFEGGRDAVVKEAERREAVIQERGKSKGSGGSARGPRTAAGAARRQRYNEEKEAFAAGLKRGGEAWARDRRWGGNGD